ncbi:MAG: hypothetical protein IPK07_17870 [Deltaproteobacteria bacterium]|nr:hypothetical protein [Deltaproteobacteria bacterium]
MATKDPGSDPRKGARFDVSLPMRFTEDGENFSDGVVTSLSSIGLFVQTQRVPGLGASIWFDLGLGGGLAPIRGRAKVGTLNRRFGTDVVTGFGIEFENPREDINDALAALEPNYPGAVRLETQGNLVWPIAPDPDRPDPGHEGDGLRIGTPDGWVGAGGETGNDAPAVAVGAALNRPIRDFLDMIRDLNGQILACPSERVPFVYQGRLLGPSTGVAKSAIVAGLIALDREEEEERRRSAEQARAEAAPEAAAHEPPAVDVIATPVEGEGGEWTSTSTTSTSCPSRRSSSRRRTPRRLRRPLRSRAPRRRSPRSPPRRRAGARRFPTPSRCVAGCSSTCSPRRCAWSTTWRAAAGGSSMWNEQLVSIEQGSALLAESIERLAEISRATEATSGDETRELMTESLRGLDAVHTFLERVSWNARAFTSQDEVFRAYDDFVAEEREVKSGARPVKEKKKLFDAAATPATTTVRVKSKPQPVKIVVALALLAAASVAAYFSVQSSRKIIDSSKVHPPSTISVQAIADAFEKSNSNVRMTIDGIAMEGAQARVTVAAEWPYKPKQVRQREVDALVAILADKGFTSAVVVTSEGIERATWNKGVVSVVE